MLNRGAELHVQGQALRVEFDRVVREGCQVRDQAIALRVQPQAVGIGKASPCGARSLYDAEGVAQGWCECGATAPYCDCAGRAGADLIIAVGLTGDRKSTRLNSSHV